MSCSRLDTLIELLRGASRQFIAFVTLKLFSAVGYRECWYERIDAVFVGGSPVPFRVVEGSAEARIPKFEPRTQVYKSDEVTIAFPLTSPDADFEIVVQRYSCTDHPRETLRFGRRDVERELSDPWYRYRFTKFEIREEVLEDLSDPRRVAESLLSIIMLVLARMNVDKKAVLRELKQLLSAFVD